MLLLSQEELNNYKITSYERAIIFSTLLLSGGDLLDNYSNNISISELFSFTELPVKSVLLIKIKLPCKKEESFRSFGGFIKNINEINLNSPQPLLINMNDITAWTFSEYPLPDKPIWIDTFEEYLFWLVTNYQSEMILNDEINYNLISIRTDFTAANINMEINIPFDYQKQLIYQNYIVSVLPIYLWGKVLTPPAETGIMGNNSVINNLTLIGN